MKFYKGAKRLGGERESGRNDSGANGKVGETTRGRNDSGRKGKWAKRLRGERESGRNDPISTGALNPNTLSLQMPTKRATENIKFEPGHEKMCLMSYANYKGADQPAHPRSLISAFVVRCLDS